MTTVLFDVRRATWRPHLGLSRYTRGIIEGIRKLSPPDIRVVPLDVRGSPHWHDLGPIAVGSGHSFAGRLSQEQIGMVRASRRGDLLHLPWHEGPAVSACPLVVSVHDIASLEHADTHRWRYRAYYNSLLRLYVRTARRILVPSQATMDALEYRWPGRPYRLVPLAVDETFTVGSASATREHAVLYTGGFEARKRLPDLLAAFELLARRDGAVRLIITGEPDPETLNLLRAASAADRIELVGRVDEQALADLYRRAAVVAYPSESEGFGFPVLEGFASGTPVVACASGSIPEVSGGVALLVPPRSSGDLADALASVLSDSALAARLRDEGLRRAGDFGWQRTAQLTLEAYREALS